MHLNYDLSEKDTSVLERVKDIIFKIKTFSNTEEQSLFPEWLMVGSIDLNNLEMRNAAWGSYEIPNLNDPAQRKRLEDFLINENRWDWESWMSPWLEEKWELEVEEKQNLIRLYVSEYPSGLLGPMSYLIQMAGANTEIVPTLEFR